MQVISYSKYLRMSPKKAKFLADSIKKMKPTDAIYRLTFGKEKGFILFAKAIKSALSDSENNYKLDKNSLFFKSLEVGKGPHLKRWQPVARGMAHQIKKRMTHLKIVLEEKKVPREGEVPPSLPAGRQVPLANKALDTRGTRDSRGTSK